MNKTTTVFQMVAINENEKVILSVHPSERIIDYHTHDFFEFNYILRGECNNTVEGKNIHMEEGDLILLPPNVYHSVYCQRDSYILNISVNSAFFYDLNVEYRALPSMLSVFLDSLNKKECHTYFFCKNAKSIKNTVFNMLENCLRRFNPVYYQDDAFLEYIKQIYLSHQNIDFYNFKLAEIRLREIILALIYNENKNSQLSAKLVRNCAKLIPILDFIAHNYQSVTLEKLSLHFHYAKAHISRLLKEKTGCNFSQILINTRLSNAMLLLERNDLSIDEISRLVGYDAPEYFYRLFKKHIKCTPQEFRKRLHKKLNPPFIRN